MISPKSHKRKHKKGMIKSYDDPKFLQQNNFGGWSTGVSPRNNEVFNCLANDYMDIMS